MLNAGPKKSIISEKSNYKYDSLSGISKNETNETNISCDLRDSCNFEAKDEKSKKRLFGKVAFVTSVLIALVYAGRHVLPEYIKPKEATGETPETGKINKKSGEILFTHPFSDKSPPSLGFPSFERGFQTSPGPVFGKHGRNNITESTGLPKPTNAWYQNLLLGGAGSDPTQQNKAYTLPYIVDTVGPIVGLRLNWPFMLGSSVSVTANYLEKYSLTLGSTDEPLNRYYEVLTCNGGYSPLGILLKWGEDTGSRDRYMISPVTRGMPFGTMKYYGGVRPTIASGILPSFNPIVDSNINLKCGTLLNDGSTTGSERATVEQNVLLHFSESDFSWIVTFSRPVEVECFINADEVNKPPPPPGVVISDNSNAFQLKVADEEVSDLVVKIALVDDCTTQNSSSNYCKAGNFSPDYFSLLKVHADVHSECPDIRYSFESIDGTDVSMVHFDWDVQSTRHHPSDVSVSNPPLARGSGGNLRNSKYSDKLLVYALSNQIDNMDSPITRSSQCVNTLRGKMCLVLADQWIIREDLGDPITFNAPIPPRHWAIPALADSLSQDIKFELPDNYRRGAGDTYFSGKMLSKQARIILIADELRSYASRTISDELENNIKLTIEECKQASLPTDDEFNNAIGKLKEGVEVWLNGTAESIFTYDVRWGGVVNCGCNYDGETESCYNRFPNCPAFSDPGMNFGHGFYNDHHFHHGYHIYAAAVVSKFDNAWGRKYFEQVLLLIRDIANPSPNDHYFPRFRMKDFFLGLSYASGIATLGGQPYPNGRNQESSSEAIASYEAMALYGKVMIECWTESHDPLVAKHIRVAKSVSDLGRLLTMTEVRAADRYYHVRHDMSEGNSIYPSEYTKPVIGILWQTMVQFQTWFGNAPYLAIGIQLLPLTAIAGKRDDPKWASSLYSSFSSSCNADPVCSSQGWSILLYGILATIGKPEVAMEQVLKLPDEVFRTPGGNGHSLSNTLWYVSTRKEYNFTEEILPTNEREKNEYRPDKVCPLSVCKISIGHCSLEDAPYFCDGGSNAGGCSRTPWNTVDCPNSCMLQAGCNEARGPDQVCSGDLCDKLVYKCPIPDAPYLCYKGQNTGGCSNKPWSQADCPDSCKLEAECVEGAPREFGQIPSYTGNAKDLASISHQSGLPNSTSAEGMTIDLGMCQVCQDEVCANSRFNECPLDEAPFVCLEGSSSSGCSTKPWKIGVDCKRCCFLSKECIKYS